MSVNAVAIPREPQRLLYEDLKDMESVAQVMGWNQSFRQLEPGDLEASILVVGHERCTTTRVRFNRSFHQLGQPPRGYLTFGFPDEGIAGLRVGGVDISPPPMINFNTSQGLDVVTLGPFSASVLSFSPELLKYAARINGLQQVLAEPLGSCPGWSFDELDVAEFRALLGEIYAVGESPDYGLSLREYHEAFDFELATAVVQIMAASQVIEPESKSSRYRALQRALAFIDEGDCMTLTMADVCAASFTSLSTLHRAFVEEFGVSPKAYIRSRRLAGVQKVLVNAAGNARVTDLANEWGFFHMGAFAADYKKQFGELPSATLQRSFNSQS